MTPCGNRVRPALPATESMAPAVSDRDAHDRAIKTIERRDAAAPEVETVATRKVEEPDPELRQAVDPLALVLSMPVLSAPASPSELSARPSALDPMVTEIVQSLAWGGDRRRGAARIELGGKRFGGASVTVHAEGDAVTIELGGLVSVDVRELGERLRERLEKRGLVVRVTAES